MSKVYRINNDQYLNQCRLIVDWTVRNNVQWTPIQSTIIFTQENLFENILYEM